ncbi:MAG: GNAT family N-acetyltransferase [Flavobacteriaceae bacterium]|nr:GNAT family N-acetyltransferase [Flavobacteriaceae bacterium]
MKIFIETERLILREILPTDVDGLFELDSDPEVHRYLGNKPITRKAQIVEVIHSVRQQYVEHGMGRFAIVDKKTNAFMGWTGLKLETKRINNHQNYYDLGYRLIRKYWGQGIASESAIASIDYAFNMLNLEKVYAAANCENIGSNKILQKVGLNFIETFYYEDLKCNWYSMDKNDYDIKKGFQ